MRRRRPRVLWFPPLGARVTQLEDDTFTGGTTFEVPVFGSGDFGFGTLPVTFDQGQENALSTSLTTPITLADLMSSAWRLRRMITNVFATYRLTGIGAGDPASGQHPACAFSVGAMVLATDASGVPNKADTQPLARENYTDPWIWRRVWVLGQGQHLTREGAGLNTFAGFRASAGALLDATGAFANFPQSTTDYGYLAGGPHIDQKTNRVIGPEERLFLIFGTKPLPITSVNAIDSTVVGFVDYRLLGGLQRSTNRRNASR